VTTAARCGVDHAAGYGQARRTGTGTGSTAREPIAGLGLVDDEAVPPRIADRGDPDRLVLARIERLIDRVDPLDPVAAQHALELQPDQAHALEQRRIAARARRADRAIEVVEHRQQRVDQLAARLVGLAPGVALEPGLGRLEAAQRAQRGLSIDLGRRRHGLAGRGRHRRIVRPHARLRNADGGQVKWPSPLRARARRAPARCRSLRVRQG
jgi:hypothetical protein